MGDVAERPETFVREAVIVAVLFLVTKPHPAQGVLGMVRRHAKPIVLVHHLGVGLTGAVGNPCTVTGHQDRFHGCHQSASGDEHLYRLVT